MGVRQGRGRGQWSAALSSLSGDDETGRVDVTLRQRTRSTTSMVSIGLSVISTAGSRNTVVIALTLVLSTLNTQHFCCRSVL